MLLPLQISKDMLDLPPNYENDGDMYPPRVVVDLERTSEKRDYTVTMRGFNRECQFTLNCPKLGCNTVNG